MALARNRSALATLGGLLLGVAAGCNQASLSVVVEVPDAYKGEELTFQGSVYAPGAAAEVGTECGDFHYGDHTFDELSPSLVVQAPLEDTDALGDVPRLGDKLIVVEGLVASSTDVMLTGCEPVGDIEGDVTVTVTLEPSIHLEIDTGGVELVAEVPWGGEGDIHPLPRVVARDLRGEPIAGSPVRVSLIAADGALADEPAVLETDEDGALEVEVATSTLGPFTLEVAPRTPAGVAPAPRLGFARPAVTTLDPFGDASVRAVHPVPIGPRGIGFVGVIDDGVVGRVQFALPTGAQDPDGLPVLVVSEPNPPVQGDLRLQAVGFDPGRDEVVTLFRRTLGGHLEVVALDAPLGQVHGSTTVGGGFSLAEVAVLAALPVGLCETHRLATPLLLVMVPFNEDARDPDNPLLFALLSADDGLRPVNNAPAAFPTASLCVRDGQGALNRILVGRGIKGGVFGVVHFGPGIESINDEIGIAREEQQLPGIAVGQTRREGEEKMLLGVFAGFSILVDELLLLDEPADGLVLGDATTLFDLPAPPATLSTAALTVADADDYVQLLSVSSEANSVEGEEDDRAPAVLYLATGADETRLFGGMELEACQPAGACAIYPGDFNEDGIEEMWVGHTAIVREGEVPTAQVLRLSAP